MGIKRTVYVCPFSAALLLIKDWNLTCFGKHASQIDCGYFGEE